MTLPTLWFAPERRGLGAGIQTGGSGLGLMLSGLLLPVVFGWFGPHGWRVAWLLLAALVAAIWIPLLTLLRNGPAEVGQTPYGAAGPPLPPVQRRPESRDDSKPAEPDRWKDVFGNHRLWRLGLVYACFGFSYVIFATFFTAYLVREGGLSAGSAGQLWGLAGVLSIGSGLLWGALADRIGKKFGLAIVFALHALCFAAFGLARATPLLVASAALFGLTAWSIPAIMAAAVGDYTRTSLAGAALGLITIIFGVGQAIGPPIGGAIADWTQSFSGALLLAGAVALLGCLGSLALPTPTGAKA
jgi:nitrate/nitrite transporter NarK